MKYLISETRTEEGAERKPLGEIDLRERPATGEYIEIGGRLGKVYIVIHRDAASAEVACRFWT